MYKFSVIWTVSSKVRLCSTYRSVIKTVAESHGPLYSSLQWFTDEWGTGPRLYKVYPYIPGKGFATQTVHHFKKQFVVSSGYSFVVVVVASFCLVFYFRVSLLSRRITKTTKHLRCTFNNK